MMLACDLSIGYHSASAATSGWLLRSGTGVSWPLAKARREEDADSSLEHDAWYRARCALDDSSDQPGDVCSANSTEYTFHAWQRRLAARLRAFAASRELKR